MYMHYIHSTYIVHGTYMCIFDGECCGVIIICSSCSWLDKIADDNAAGIPQGSWRKGREGGGRGERRKGREGGGRGGGEERRKGREGGEKGEKGGEERIEGVHTGQREGDELRKIHETSLFCCTSPTQP